MDTCATCTHWDTADRIAPEDTEERLGMCARISDEDSPRAFIDWAGNPTMLRLTTHESFGCVLWESR